MRRFRTTDRIAMLALSALSLAVVLLGGCGLAGSGSGFDPVSGSWTGAWYRAGEVEPAGALRCRLERMSPDLWRARFDAVSGVEATYELTLRGERDGSRVTFRDLTDLGRAAGGVYEWSGEINGEVFQGTYRHPAGDGRFEMVRRREPAPRSEPLSTLPEA